MGSCPISLDIGLVLLVFGSSFGLAQILHRLVQYPVILDSYPSNKVYICAQLTSRLGMQLNLRLRSLYVLLLCLYVPYTRCYYVCTETFPAPGVGGQARVQDGVLTSYMDAAFVLLTPEGLEI